MARIGVFIDALKESLPPSFRKRLASSVQKHPNIVFCVEEEDLSAAGALSRAVKRLQEEKADGAVIVGGSPKLYEASFCKWTSRAPINPYRFAVANVREQALWTADDEDAAFMTAQKIITRAIRMASTSKSIDSSSLPLQPDVLVIGGGIVGISVALTLARAGIQVHLLDRREHLGGNAAELRKFYDRPEAVQKWLEGLVTEMSSRPNIRLHLRSHLKRLDGHVGRFQARIQDQQGAETVLQPSGIVVAVGYARQPETKGIYGHERMISFPAMEKLLSEASPPELRSGGKAVKTVSFLLDAVNEDIKIDSIHAVKQGLVLQEEFQCQVAILCRDIKVAADGMERLYRRAREKGVLFFKYETPPKLSAADEGIQVDVMDTAAIRKEDQWPVSIVCDLVVTGEAFVPDAETERLAGILKIHLGNRGFLMEDNPQLLRVRCNRRGIFVAGACRFPQELSEAVIEARAAAEEVITFLSCGAYTYDLSVAEVDPKKCAVCYTCPRLCPHAAITIEKYAERNVYSVYGIEAGTAWGAAKVDPAACYGCGICVAECPAKAITLHHVTDEQIYAQMGL